jgi:hypothetical protein
MRGAAWNCWLNLHRRFSRLRYAYGREWLQCRELQVSRYCVSLIDASWNSFAVLHCWNYCNNVFITAFRVKDASRLARSTQAGTVQSCPEHSTDCAELVSLHRALQLSSRFIMTRRRLVELLTPGEQRRVDDAEGSREHTQPTAFAHLDSACLLPTICDSHVICVLEILTSGTKIPG